MQSSALLKSIRQARIGIKGPAARRAAGLQALVAQGLITSPNDRAGIARAMATLPGPFNGSDTSPMAVGAFLDMLAGMDESDELPRFKAGNALDSDPRDNDASEPWGLGTQTIAGGAAAGTSTLTVSSMGTGFDDAVLWLGGHLGLITRVTSIEKDAKPYWLGPGGFVDIAVLDIDAEGKPMNEGLYIGRVKDSLVITVAHLANPLADDVTWTATLDAVDGSGTQRAPAGSKPFRRLRNR